ncbi:MAG: PilZ domain-containing protein [Rhizobiales bacterium]|nr:PilZ domain-containing protein [Hyphomicrobiales bacterium]
MPDATVGSKPPPQAQSQFAMLQTALGKFSDEQLFAALSQVTDLRLVGVIARRLDPATASSGRVDQTTDAQADHRSANRAKTLRSGKIIYNNKMSVSDCSIRDISETGCRISMESTAGIPKNFLLHIVNGDVRHECEVAWRSSTAMGVKFIG